MQQTIELNSYLTIGPQLKREGLHGLALDGFKTVINLSTKSELGQMKPDEEGALVEEHGMTYFHFPTSISSLGTKNIDSFLAEVEAYDAPAYMHCRLGQRAGPLALIWEAARRGASFQHVKRRARELGLNWPSPFFNDLMRRYLQTVAERRAAETAGALPA